MVIVIWRYTVSRWHTHISWTRRKEGKNEKRVI